MAGRILPPSEAQARRAMESGIVQTIQYEVEAGTAQEAMESACNIAVRFFQRPLAEILIEQDGAAEECVRIRAVEQRDSPGTTVRWRFVFQASALAEKPKGGEAP